MRIVIVGAGIAGLSAYCELRRRLDSFDSHSVVILERHASNQNTEYREDVVSRLEGGLGVCPNGMRVLRRLDPGLHDRVTRAGFPVKSTRFHTAGGYHLGDWPGSSTSPTEEYTIMIERRRVWEALLDFAGQEAVQYGAKVQRVEQNGKILLESGKIIEADMIIGADGVRSIVRQAVIDPEEEAGCDPVFQSFMNIGGIVPTEYIAPSGSHERLGATMTFGSSGFVGYGPMTMDPSSSQGNEPKPGALSLWWSTYTDNPSTAARKTTLSPSDPSIAQDMRLRHGDWADPVIAKIIRDITDQSGGRHSKQRATLDLHTPTWIVPKLPRWSRGRVILIGDAAHALPSTSGQGVSQALEDAAALAILTSHAVAVGNPSTGAVDVEGIASKFERLRKPRVEKILDGALRMQNHKREMGSFEKFFMYGILAAVSYLGRGKQEAERFDYDVEEAVSHVV